MLIFYPDLLVNNVTDITKETLCNLNVNNILLDIDDTISPNGTNILSKEIVSWVLNLKKNSVNLIIISNNSKKRAEYFAKQLGIPYIYRAMKPLPFKISKALKTILASKKNTVIIGDQIFTDVIGAKLCGIKSILVEPLSNNGNISLKIKRFIEFYIKNKFKKTIPHNNTISK